MLHVRAIEDGQRHEKLAYIVDLLHANAIDGLADADLETLLISLIDPKPRLRTPLESHGEEFERCWAEQRALRPGPAWEAAYERTQEFAIAISRLPAHSLRELKLKAQVIQWCHGDKFKTLFEDGQDTTDQRLADQIIHALLSITGAPAGE